MVAFSANPDMIRQSEKESGGIRNSAELINEAMSPLFLAVVEATEEAILNSLFQAESMTGHNGTEVSALPVDVVLEINGRYSGIRKTETEDSVVELP